MYRHFLEMVEDDGEEGAEVQAFERLGLKRYCCRRMLLTHVDLIEKLMVYNSESPLSPRVSAAAQRHCCGPEALANGDVRVDETSLCPVHPRRFCALVHAGVRGSRGMRGRGWERERERECECERELELTACMVAALEHAEAPDQ